MWKLIILLLMLAPDYSHAQIKETINQSNGKPDHITIKARFDKNAGTKDGYYLGDYIVDLNVSMKEAEKLDGKLLEITGELVVEKGLESQPREFNEKGTEITRQGRRSDTKHIIKTNFKVVRE